MWPRRGTEILFERFGAREVHAFDIDADMVARARRRLSGYAREFIAELERQGIMVEEKQLEWFFGDFVVGGGRRVIQRITLTSWEEKADHAEAN